MTETEKQLFNRAELLFGIDAMERINHLRVIIFGVGGVGSWCAEGLVRSGVSHITLVDSDRVAFTNCNRQLMATTTTIGQVKVDAMRAHLLEVNPEADITALEAVYSEATATDFHLEHYDVIIDAIDSLRDKAALILHATSITRANPSIKFYSSMGAALRIDPTRIRVSEFWKVKGDPLARALRNKFKGRNQFPQAKFQCVYSEEAPLPNIGTSIDDPAGRAQINGSLVHITSVFGMTLAGLVLQQVVNK